MTVPKDSLHIFTPTGMMGYGFSHELFHETITQSPVSAIILDSGSTDSGPSKLALGTTSCPEAAYTREFEEFLYAAHHHNIPTIIGSAGGSGTNAHVDMYVRLIHEVVKRNGYRSMKIVTVYSEIPKETIRKAWKSGQVTPCGEAVPELLEEDIDEAPCVVAQMGHEPYLAAMRANPDFDIIVGGRSYDPAPYVAFSLFKGFEDLGLAYHMGKIMECGGHCVVPKRRESLAVVRRDSFDVTPVGPGRCTAVSVAAHTLYEKTRPDVLKGPGGTLHLEDTKYEELDDGVSVRVKGARFVPDERYMVKLEAARTKGYHSMFFGGIGDPILIAQVDYLLDQVKSRVASSVDFPYELKLSTYGGQTDRISMFLDTKPKQASAIPATIAIVGEARAETQGEATHVVNAARIACMHASYPGQKATSGNFAMPGAPLDIPMGRVCEFCVYHLLPVEDPVSHFPIQTAVAEGSGQARLSPFNVNGSAAVGTNGHTNGHKKEQAVTVAPLVIASPPGFQRLGDMAKVIRSKNAGPYEITFDVMFDSLQVYEQVKASQALSTETIQDLYELESADIIATIWWEQALAFKATVKRPIVSGSFGETDTHGSVQHIRLVNLQVPNSVAKDIAAMR